MASYKCELSLTKDWCSFVQCNVIAVQCNSFYDKN